MHKRIYILYIVITISFLINNHIAASVSTENSVYGAEFLCLADTIPEELLHSDSLKSDVLKEKPAEVIVDTLLSDQTKTSADTIDHLLPEADSLQSDTLRTDSLDRRNRAAIDAEVVYTAKDSVVFGMDQKKVFLYKEAKVTYLDLELTADYIEFDMTNNEVFAKGMPDSSGVIQGKPLFKDDTQEMNAGQLRYNFKSQKGFIESVITEQEGGFLHAEKTKKDEKGHIHLKNGMYTTCDAEHPHFYVALTKAKSIPGDKIVSGPAYLVLEDVPLPIGIPFGFFPNTKTNTSGILIPQYGEETNRGFYLRNGGYYLAINEFLDLTVTGDIYTNGTWGLRAGTNYRKRYRFNGGFNARIYKNVSGEKGLSNYSKSSDYSIMWSHNQDPKANPNQTFRASVNLSSSRFDQNHSRILTNALTNTKQSSISFQKRWPGSPFNFSISANHSQNSNTGNVNLNLPRMAFSMSRLYPFRSKNSTGKGGFWEDIQLSYTSNLDNRIATNDTLLFTGAVWEDMNNGFEHSIPLTWNFKPKRINSFTFSPNLSYKGVAYTKTVRKYRALNMAGDADSTYVEEKNGLYYAHSYYPSVSASLAPKIYGMYQFREKSRVQVIRHVMSPSISFSYIPDVSEIVPDYYRELKDENGDVIETYSIFEGGIYGTPTISGSSKTMSLRLNNNLEAKVRSKSDTVEELSKVKIIDNFNFSSSVNFKDSIKFRPVSFNASTSLLKRKLSLRLNGSMDPYALDENYRRINSSEFKKSGKLVRLTTAALSMGLNLKGGSRSGSSSSGDEDLRDTNTPQGVRTPGDEYDDFDEDYYYGEYVDFNIPWSLRIDYSLRYSKPRDESSVIQTVRLSGDFSLTQKWKIGYNTGYDFKNSKVTTSNLSIYRDLHCWEMRLTAVPFGNYKSFNFQINAKSAILQDLKYNKRIPWQDNF